MTDGEDQIAGIRILYEDRGVLAVEKQPATMAQGSRSGEEGSLLSLLASEMKKDGSASFLTPVHRLDYGVGGVMLFAKTRQSAAALSNAMQSGETEKEYLCMVWGCPEEAKSEWEDYLYHDSGQNKTFLVTGPRKGAKAAKLSYRILGTSEADGRPVALLGVRLFTGRTHQIRAQLSGHGYPILCDGKYGGRRPLACRSAGIALWSYRFSFPAVRGKEQAAREEVVSVPGGGVWDLFSENLFELRKAAIRPS
ncbi:MAG: RNA pseudouridine synthase [Clostridia bacterium]|nr:RNA pseudouridine synthase [Clostridia bacterium]